MATFGHRVVQAAAVETSAVEARQQWRVKSKDSPFGDPTEDMMWDYWERLPEISFPATVMSNVARLVSFFPAEEPASGDEDSDPTKTENTAVLKVWEQVGGEQKIAEWVSDLVTHYWVPGQAWLAATRVVGGKLRLVEPDDADGDWEVLSTADLKDAGGFDKLADIPSGDVRFWRLYRPSKRRRTRPDSPVRHVAFDCEMLWTYRMNLRANSVGRAAAGLKAMPQRLLQEKAANGRSFEDQMVEDMRAARKVGDPASEFPLIAWVRDKDEAEIVTSPPVKFADPAAVADLLAKEGAAIRAIATGLDMPAEFLSGLGGVNHWGAWLIQRQNYDYHLDPMVVRILRDVTPWWKARLEASGVDSTRQMLWRNPDSAVSNPNSWEQVQWLYDNFLIAGEFARNSADVGDIAAPEEEEIMRRIAIDRARNTRLAVPGAPVEDPFAPGTTPESANPSESDDMPDAIQAAATPELARLARRLAVVDQTLIVETERTVDREATRLLRNLKQRINAAAKAASIAVTDPDRVGEELGVSAVLALLSVGSIDELVNPTDVDVTKTETAIARAQTETDRALSRMGATPVQSRDPDREAATGLLAGTVAAAVAAAVFSRPTPTGESAGEIVPFALIRETLDVAGGGLAARSADGEEAWELVGNGRHTVDSLTRVGVASEAFQWVYGATPRQTFEPHLNLDGEVFDRWDAPVLSQEGTGGEWVGGQFFYPADHRGCRCTYERVLAYVSPPQSVAASARG